MGYTVVEIGEVYHYDEWSQYDGNDEETGLFTGYINLWLKEKQEASGWPDWVKTDEDRARYIAAYKEREGVDLDPVKIELNPGRRSMAKLYLNSFWVCFCLFSFYHFIL